MKYLETVIGIFNLGFIIFQWHTHYVYHLYSLVSDSCIRHFDCCVITQEWQAVCPSPLMFITLNYLHFFYKISKDFKGFTVSRAFIDPQQLIYPRTPVKRGRERKGQGRGGPLQFTFLAAPLLRLIALTQPVKVARCLIM